MVEGGLQANFEAPLGKLPIVQGPKFVGQLPMEEFGSSFSKAIKNATLTGYGQTLMVCSMRRSRMFSVGRHFTNIVLGQRNRRVPPTRIPKARLPKRVRIPCVALQCRVYGSGSGTRKGLGFLDVEGHRYEEA